MLFLVPYLFPPPRLADAATHDLALPALQTLLTRGRHVTLPGDGVEAAVCEALGIKRQQDWPIAPISLTMDGGAAEDAYWLRADPVHLRVLRDRVVLADANAAVPTRAEADTLAADIAAHFGASFSPLPLHPQRWYLRLPRAPRLTTTLRSMAAGRDVEGCLPQGADALSLRAQLNELQMLLHAHPVNLAREARGEASINSLWLWGGGTLPHASGSIRSVYANGPDARALATFSGTVIYDLPSSLQRGPLEPDAVTVLDMLTPPGEHGDAWAWREAAQSLETDWCRPMLQQMRRRRQQELRLHDPISGRAVDLRAADLWKIWRRLIPLNSLLV